MERTVITIAAGKKLYVEYASNLALSFIYWNRNTTIKFVLITDQPKFIPKELTSLIEIIVVDPQSVGEGFSSKLILDKYLKDGQNLFIDADCLIYGNLNPVFEKFKGHPISTIGHTVIEGEDIGFCRNIKELLKTTSTTYYPIFCGSIYYFEGSKGILSFFKQIRELLPAYDQLGLTRLRQRENEEPLVSIALAMSNLYPMADDGTVKSDRMFFDYINKNILSGHTSLWTKDELPNPVYSLLKKSNPVIIHYNARFTETYEYISDAKRLQLVVLKKWNKNFADWWVTVTYEKPLKMGHNITETFKNAFRPFVHKVVGIRRVKNSKRI